ncbi:hypothetical protein DXG03_007593 [Asterophora parasitica]|uniref:Uncharacterized protein n=1 Tax=Asterophora parasitica TaxID=117018 RepID=A0A9P7G0S1_9AGAR|nr:hypothetical protein DXG03_007593 [Asterophora parasitica]
MRGEDEHPIAAKNLNWFEDKPSGDEYTPSPDGESKIDLLDNEHCSELRSLVDAQRKVTESNSTKNKHKALEETDGKLKKLEKADTGLCNGWEEPVLDNTPELKWDELVANTSHQHSSSWALAMSISSGPGESVPASEGANSSENEVLGGISDDQEERRTSKAHLMLTMSTKSLKPLAKVVPTIDVPEFVPSQKFLSCTICCRQDIQSLKDIPPALKDTFENIFSPHIYKIFSTGTPWASVFDYEPEITELWAQVFPCIPFDSSGGDLQKVVMKIVEDCLAAWCSRIRSIAMTAMEDLNLPDSSPEYIANWATWALSGTYKAQPFYWQEYADTLEDGTEPKGMFQHPLILAGLSHHIGCIATIPEAQCTKGYPRTTLIMAIQAAIHAISHWTMGGFLQMTRPLGDFTSENWNNDPKRDPRNYPQVPNGIIQGPTAASDLGRVVDALTDNIWNAIIEVAMKLACGKRKAKQAPVVAPKDVQSSDIEIVNDDLL